MRQKAILWWQALSERERRILRIWALAVLALLVWFALLAPLNKRIAQLETRIPQLESRLNAMRAVPSSAPQAKTSANKDSADLRSTLFRLLSEKKISAELRALSSTRVEVRLPEMSATCITCFSKVSRRATSTVPFSMSRGPIAMRTG